MRGLDGNDSHNLSVLNIFFCPGIYTIMITAHRNASRAFEGDTNSMNSSIIHSNKSHTSIRIDHTHTEVDPDNQARLERPPALGLKSLHFPLSLSLPLPATSTSVSVPDPLDPDCTMSCGNDTRFPFPLPDRGDDNNSGGEGGGSPPELVGL